MPDTDSSAEDLAAAVEQARRLAAGTDLVPLGAAPPEQLHLAYGAQAAEAARAAHRLREIAKRRKEEMEARMRVEQAELQNVLGPLEAQLKRLQESVWTVSLYLGSDEQIEMLRDGEPAPDGTPITLRQLILAMDEESLIAAEEQGIDAQRVDDFAAWLLARPEHLQQVLPDPKGVVVLVPSRQTRDYGNQWANASMAAANAEPHWLIRNGERLYLLKTNFKISNRLLPTRTEFEEFFTTVEGYGADQRRVPLEPGSQAWLDAEKAAGERQRHYMRVMLILQGLADRTTVFHPLPVGGVNFLSVAAQDDGQVRIINEIDNVLTSGWPSFPEWQAGLAKQLRVGLRVVGVFMRRGAFGEINGYERLDDRHTRIYPERASWPKTGQIYVIEAATPDGGYIIRYKRTDRVDDVDGWGRYQGTREAKTRASCTIRPGDSFILPVDLVDEAAAEHYLHSRTERLHYLEMVPALRAVLAAKRAEREAEAPFRMLLAARIAAERHISIEQATADVPDLVAWWKLTNRHHRPLVADPETEARAISAIVREWGDRFAARKHAEAVADIERNIVAELRQTHPDAVCIARRRDAAYVVYEAADDLNIWVHEHRYRFNDRQGGLRPISTDEWRIVPPKTAAALTVLWQAERWAKWDHLARRQDHLTGPEVAKLTATMRDLLVVEGAPIAVVYRETVRHGWDSANARRFEGFAWTNRLDSSTFGRRDNDPGRGMVMMWFRWSRSGGEIVLTAAGRRAPCTWGQFHLGGIHNKDRSLERPWRTDKLVLHEDRLVWADPDQLEVVAREWAAIDAEQEITRKHNAACWAVERDADARWKATEEETARQRFLRDYAGAEDLWEHQKGLLNIQVQHADGLRDGISQLILEGADLTRFTVEDAIRKARAHPDWVLKKLPDSYKATKLAVPGGDGDGAGE